MRGRAASLFLLVFCGHAWFASALCWNQSARVAAILTFVEPGPNRFTLRIDEFVASDARNLMTGDWALGADGGALALAFCTLIFPYDTSLWGHPTAAACLLAALCLAWWPGGVRQSGLAGALGGFAVLCDYLAVFGLTAASLALLVRRTSWRQRLTFGAAHAGCTSRCWRCPHATC